MILRLKWTFFGFDGPCFCLKLIVFSQCWNLHDKTFLSNIFFQKKLTLPSTFFLFKNTFIHIFSSLKKIRFCLKILFSFVFENDYLKRSLLFRFQPKTTSLNSSFRFPFWKKKTKRQNVVFFIVYKNAAQH